MADGVRPPVSQSPLWKNGKSLLEGTVTARQGLASALADEQRTPDQAEILHNMQQWKKLGIWTSHGIGYTRDNPTVINSGAGILEFGKFYDSTGTLNLLLQCGGNVYPYNTSTHAVGTAIAGLTGLSTSAIPCMRAYSPSTQTTQPITIYCNGLVNPIKITSTSASAPLAYNNGTNQETATIGGTVAAGNVTTITLTNSGLTISPRTISYTAATGDGINQVAAGLATAINADTVLQQSLVKATASGAVVTINAPQILGAVTYSSSVQGSVTCTLVSVAGATTWPIVFNGKTYQNPKFCEPFGDRMVFAGFPDAGTMFDVLVTNQGSAEKMFQSSTLLATDGYVFTVRAELGPVTGVKSFRPNNLSGNRVLIVGQRDGVSQLTGNDPTSYSFDILTSAYGIVNNRCWAQVLDDLIYLTDKGVYSYSSLVNNNTEPSDALSFVVSDKIQQMDFQKYPNLFFALHHPITQEIHFYGPWTVDTGVPQRGLILSYKGGMATPVWSTKDGFVVNCGIDYRNVFYGGGSDGYVQLHYSGDTYNGAAILFHYLSALITVGSVTQAGRMQNMAIVTEGAAQQYAVSAYYYTKFIDGTCRKLLATPSAFVISQANQGTTVLPFNLGTSSFPGDFVKVHNYRPIGRGYGWKVELTNTNIAGDGLDYSSVTFTISIGGFIRR